MLDIIFKVSYNLKKDDTKLKGNKMKILYARTSSQMQNLSRQLVNADDYDRVYTEQVSGKNTKDRPELNNMLKAIRKDDLIEVHSMDRMARNLRDLLNIVETIQQQGATIHFIKENMTFAPTTNDPTQKLMMTMFGAFAEFERNLILSRIKEGQAIAKKKGVYAKAHPTKKNKVEIENIKYDRQCGMTEKELMNKYHISKPTLYRYLKK